MGKPPPMSEQNTSAVQEYRGHTPGPWRVVYSKRNGAALRVEAPNDRHVPGAVGSVVRQNGIGMPACGIGHANARLIASAPDMESALEPFADVDGEGSEDFPDDTKVTVTFGRTTNYALTLGDFRRARAAIAKATGSGPSNLTTDADVSAGNQS